MDNCDGVKITRSQRRVSFEEQQEEVVMEFSQQPKRHTTDGMVTQDNAQLTVSPQSIAGLFKSQE